MLFSGALTRPSFLPLCLSVRLKASSFPLWRQMKPRLSGWRRAHVVSDFLPLFAEQRKRSVFLSEATVGEQTQFESGHALSKLSEFGVNETLAWRFLKQIGKIYFRIVLIRNFVTFIFGKAEEGTCKRQAAVCLLSVLRRSACLLSLCCSAAGRGFKSEALLHALFTLCYSLMVPPALKLGKIDIWARKKPMYTSD